MYVIMLSNNVYSRKQSTNISNREKNINNNLM